jgi:hypothetical protein
MSEEDLKRVSQRERDLSFIRTLSGKGAVEVPTINEFIKGSSLPFKEEYPPAEYLELLVLWVLEEGKTQKDDQPRDPKEIANRVFDKASSYSSQVDKQVAALKEQQPDLFNLKAIQEKAETYIKNAIEKIQEEVDTNGNEININLLEFLKKIADVFSNLKISSSRHISTYDGGIKLAFPQTCYLFNTLIKEGKVNQDDFLAFEKLILAEAIHEAAHLFVRDLSPNMPLHEVFQQSLPPELHNPSERFCQWVVRRVMGDDSQLFFDFYEATLKIYLLMKYSSYENLPLNIMGELLEISVEKENWPLYNRLLGRSALYSLHSPSSFSHHPANYLYPLSDEEAIKLLISLKKI